MKVIFVNRYFHPDISATSQILSDLAFHLASEYEVHVVTSRQRYDAPQERLPRQERISGVFVHRVWTTGFGRTYLPGRAIDYLSFYVFASAELLRLTHRADVVVALTDPPIISLPAMLVAKLKGASLVNWIQDVFPETAAALGLTLLGGPLGWAIAWARDRSLLAANMNVALCERMAARIITRGLPRSSVLVIHNWATGSQVTPIPARHNSLRKEWKLEERFVVGYSGNMGRAHDLEALLRVAQVLRYREDIVFLFVGGGSQRDSLERLARANRLDNVLFHPYQPRNLLGQSLTLPDCHVVSLKPSLEGLVLPSKLYSSLAAGRPILFLGDTGGEICQMMRALGRFGVCFGPNDDRAIADAVVRLCDHPEERALMGKNARLIFESNFDQPIALQSWSSLLKRIETSVS